MNYLKDVVIKCKENKIDKNNIKYYMPEQLSPYLEINQEDLNSLDISQDGQSYIGVNPYFKNAKIFWDILSPNIAVYPKLKKVVFNILCHFIAETDYLMLKRAGDYIKEFIERAVIAGNYGDLIQENYELFNKSEKEKILNEIALTYRLGENMERFISISNEIFKGSITYDYSQEKNILDMFIPQKEEGNNVKKLEFLTEMFLPINLKIKIYWEYHFLIIGVDETSKIEKCRLF